MSIDLVPWQGQAVDAVAQVLYARHPELAQRFGERGLAACRADIHHHFEYLDAALAADDPAQLTNYAIWLKRVLDSRGVPSSHLAESFDLLAGFFASQLPAAEAACVSAILTTARDALARNDLPTPYTQTRLPPLQEVPRYREAILSGNQHEAFGLISRAMQGGIRLSEAAVRLVQPAMYEIGWLWQENRITVAQEHLATAVSQNVLARAYMQADFAPPVGRMAMFAGVAGNHHSLGLRMLSDTFETAGWEVLFLGADVPIANLIRQVDASHPDLLALSLSLPGHLSVARETAERLRAELGSRCPPIWVGGLATLTGAPIWRSLKADGWAADALHALEQATP